MNFVQKMLQTLMFLISVVCTIMAMVALWKMNQMRRLYPYVHMWSDIVD